MITWMIVLGWMIVCLNIVSLAFKCLFVLSLQPSVTRYDFLFKNVPPIKENIGAYIFHVC